MGLSEPSRAPRRTVLAVLLTAAAVMLCAAPGQAHDGRRHGIDRGARSAEAQARVAAAGAAAVTPERKKLADEPVLPGTEWSTDFQIAPDGDVYVAAHDGTIRRYQRVGGTVAHPRYDLEGEIVWTFAVTQATDRGLVGIAIDAGWSAGHRYLYAFYTRGTQRWVGNERNGLRRSAHLVRIRIPQIEVEGEQVDGLPSASDLKVILGGDALANPDSACKPFSTGEAASAGETDAHPNGVEFLPGGLIPDLSDDHVYPDGDLATRADGAYDCIPSDSDTHGPGTVASAPDGSLYVSIGDAAVYSPKPNALRTQNLESYAGKILHIDRNGRGLANHPFCAGETDLTRVCTKVWVMGLRNAYRVHLLPADGATGGQPALAVADVGNYTQERLTIAHPGDNLGWPCWEGTYYNHEYGGRDYGGTPIRSAWGGPDLVPAGGVATSCERKTLTGNSIGGPKPSADIQLPSLTYPHDPIVTTGKGFAAIVGGGRLARIAGADPSVALPDEWTGSLIFADYVRGWIRRISPDPTDPGNADRDGGLWLPADEGRGPLVQTDDTVAGGTPDPITDLVTGPPPGKPDGSPIYHRLTTRQGPDGALWYIRAGEASTVGGIYRLRTAPVVEAAIGAVTGACAASGQPQGNVTITAADSGPGAEYAWDLDGDGTPDRSGRTVVLTPDEVPILKGGSGWIRLTVAAGASRSTTTRYLCTGPTPRVPITSPADGAQVVLGTPTVVRATRAAGDAALTGIPDSALRWSALTYHGTHTHALVRRDTPFELEDGQQRLQLTVTPDRQHDFGSSTEVRIYAPQADGNAVAQTVRLYPKPVDVTMRSAPAGARITISREGPATVVGAAPGVVELPAGFATELTAQAEFTDPGGRTWRFKRWSDGSAKAARDWIVPAGDGDAPVAEYDDVTVPPTTASKPPDPTAPDPGQGDQQPAGASSPAPGTTLPAPKPIPPLAPTPQELATAPVTTALLRGRGSKVTGIRATLNLGRRSSTAGIVFKAAVRDADCRWWSFGRDRFVGPPRAPGARSSKKVARRCVVAPSWKHVSSSWTADTAVATVDLGTTLPPGRYALRIRAQNAAGVLAERVRAIVVE